MCNTIQIKPKIYVLETWWKCDKCKSKVDIYCLGAEGVIDEYMNINQFLTITDVMEVPLEIEKILKGTFESYKLGYSRDREEECYLNHCTECGEQIEDAYLHGHPGDAFSPWYKGDAEDITMYETEIKEVMDIKGLYSSNLEFVPVYVKKKFLKERVFSNISARRDI